MTSAWSPLLSITQTIDSWSVAFWGWKVQKSPPEDRELARV